MKTDEFFEKHSLILVLLAEEALDHVTPTGLFCPSLNSRKYKTENFSMARYLYSAPSLDFKNSSRKMVVAHLALAFTLRAVSSASRFTWTLLSFKPINLFTWTTLIFSKFSYFSPYKGVYYSRNDRI